MFTLSAEDSEAYDRDGVVCLRQVLHTAELEGLRLSINEQVANIGKSRTAYDFEALAAQMFDRDEALDAGSADRFDLDAMKSFVKEDALARPLREKIDGDGGMFFYDVAGWKMYKGIRDVALDSVLPEIMAKLLVSKRIHFWEDTTFVKAPYTKQLTPFHQDLSYFQTTGRQCAVIWIPLDPADENNGVTRYIRGSHHWGEVYAPSVFVSQSTTKNSPYPRLPDIESNEADYDIISFDVEPGDVIIHDVLTVHGAGGNKTHMPRRAISLRYCGDDMRFCDKPGAIPQAYVSHNLQDGDELYCADYPVVWPRPWPGKKLSDVYAYHRAVSECRI